MWTARSLRAPVLLLVAALGAIAVLDARMRSTGGPGILGLEFAGTERRSMKLLDAWGQKGIHAARWENAVDYVFILAYVTCLVAAVTRARERAAANRLTGLLRLGGVVIALPVLAGVLDAVQNLALLLLLGGHATGATPTVSLVCGVATALLGVAALGYVAAVAIAGGRDRGG